MPLPQNPPGGGERCAYTHFHHCPPAGGKSFEAWIAGPAMWFFCHPGTRTKPCLQVMTCGAVVCMRCPGKVPCQDIGYQPLYRCIDGKPVFVVVHEYQRDDLEQLRFLTRVKVGREEGKGEGVWVQQTLNQRPAYHSTLPERMLPQDLSETLLRVWNIPDLTEWYRKTGGRSDNPLSLKPSTPTAESPKQSTGEEFSEMYVNAARRWNTERPAGESTDDVLKRLQHQAAKFEPKKNRKHTSDNGKPPPKG